MCVHTRVFVIRPGIPPLTSNMWSLKRLKLGKSVKLKTSMDFFSKLSNNFLKNFQNKPVKFSSQRGLKLYRRQYTLKIPDCPFNPITSPAFFEPDYSSLVYTHNLCKQLSPCSAQRMSTHLAPVSEIMSCNTNFICSPDTTLMFYAT